MKQKSKVLFGGILLVSLIIGMLFYTGNLQQMVGIGTTATSACLEGYDNSSSTNYISITYNAGYIAHIWNKKDGNVNTYGGPWPYNGTYGAVAWITKWAQPGWDMITTEQRDCGLEQLYMIENCACGDWVKGSCGGFDGLTRYYTKTCTPDTCSQTRYEHDATCAAEVTCSCTSWIEGGCVGTDKESTRTCTPTGCANEVLLIPSLECTACPFECCANTGIYDDKSCSQIGYTCENNNCIAPTCPTCNAPTDWTTCDSNSTWRTNYYCNATTSYSCQSYTQTDSCLIIDANATIPQCTINSDCLSGQICSVGICITDSGGDDGGGGGSSCNSLWYVDDITTTCSQKTFCGTYMYLGLHTYATEQLCLAENPLPCDSCGIVEDNNLLIIIAGSIIAVLLFVVIRFKEIKKRFK